MIILFNFDTFELTHLNILSNYRVVMLKNPLQITCDLKRVFQDDHSVI